MIAETYSQVLPSWDKSVADGDDEELQRRIAAIRVTSLTKKKESYQEIFILDESPIRYCRICGSRRKAPNGSPTS